MLVYGPAPGVTRIPPLVMTFGLVLDVDESATVYPVAPLLAMNRRLLVVNASEVCVTSVAVVLFPEAQVLSVYATTGSIVPLPFTLAQSVPLTVAHPPKIAALPEPNWFVLAAR